MVKYLRVFGYVGFFSHLLGRQDMAPVAGTTPMKNSNATMAQQMAQAASAFEKKRTGHAPKGVTVVFSEKTLVITLHGVLTPAEIDLARTPAGAALIQEYHRQLFMNSNSFQHEIKRITGVEVREGTEEVVKAFTTGTVVQFYLLAQGVPADTWSDSGPGDPP